MSHFNAYTQQQYYPQFCLYHSNTYFLTLALIISSSTCSTFIAAQPIPISSFLLTAEPICFFISTTSSHSPLSNQQPSSTFSLSSHNHLFSTISPPSSTPTPCNTLNHYHTSLFLLVLHTTVAQLSATTPPPLLSSSSALPLPNQPPQTTTEPPRPFYPSSPFSSLHDAIRASPPPPSVTSHTEPPSPTFNVSLPKLTSSIPPSSSSITGQRLATVSQPARPSLGADLRPRRSEPPPSSSCIAFTRTPSLFSHRAIVVLPPATHHFFSLYLLQTTSTPSSTAVLLPASLGSLTAPLTASTVRTPTTIVPDISSGQRASPLKPVRSNPRLKEIHHNSNPVRSTTRQSIAGQI